VEGDTLNAAGWSSWHHGGPPLRNLNPATAFALMATLVAGGDHIGRLLAEAL